MKKEVAYQRLADCGIVAVIRAQSDLQLMDIAKALLDGGVIGIEVTMSTPKAIAGIERLVEALGDKAVVGVGTVLDAATCADAIHAGAEFVVSPILDLGIIETTRRLGKIAIPGALSPTEIFTAWKAGADVVKVYPGNLVGPQYVKDLLAPMPFLRLSPSGGVDAKNAGEWIKAGAVMCGAGGSLVTKAAMSNGDWGAITATARQFVENVKAARAQ
jgi:2-dehydro-3-deoxyphosphogluconate aldolase/(4S)-4-hydroxy-2-oxoglutarate aldolase